ncbi:MAG TPA: hypothetical protein VK255_01800 [Patescibacteria group bacterium]|nr:hypothetical protein [Patescibacteria group bacterium]
MSRIITANSLNLASGGFRPKTDKRVKINGRVLAMNRNKKFKPTNSNLGSAGLSLIGVCFILAFSLISLGAYYLYQVNDLATKGYEIKDMETQIQQLQKEGKKMQIREIELRSMYNLEKATQDLDLINAQNVTYVEMKSPVAMK